MDRAIAGAQDSIECDVTRTNNFSRPVCQPETKGAIGFDPVEAAVDDCGVGAMNPELGTGGMGAGKPGLGKVQGIACAPQREHPAHRSGKEGSESLRSDAAAEVRCRTAGKQRRRSEIDSETGDHAVTLPLQQDPRDLRSTEQQIVRPFEEQRQAGRGRIEGLDEC